MARASHRLAENVPGEFFVDDSCIDCATCRQIAPATFGALTRGLAYVHTQPDGSDQVERALRAQVACPTASIGSVSRLDARAASRAFPLPVAANVFYCGYASAASYGASSWLILRPDGNVLVDSPRAAAPLLTRIAALGGVRFLFLTHRDDVADHVLFRRRFGCERILHGRDVTPATRSVERILGGTQPIALAEDLLAIPCPGHTPGSMALLHGSTLFTGDHLWGSEDGTRLHASRSVCWWNWPEQVRSLERLLGFDFQRVLPGHGHPLERPSPEAMRQELRALLARLAR